MASAKALFGAAFGRFFFRDATVTSVRALGEKFRLAELEGDALTGVTWTPGDKVQVYLGEDMRTYTPIAWDAASGKTSFLLYVHGASAPGARWARDLMAGARCQFFGPRGSIAFTALPPDVTFFGDETSFAAAAALKGVRSARNVFEVESERESKRALTALGIEATLIERTADDAHLEAVARTLERSPPQSLVLTGRAQSIQDLRRRGLRPAKTKAYWSVGKSGLD
ncbi:MAG: siderophore-interacting protein [Labilithrix sp.]